MRISPVLIILLIAIMLSVTGCFSDVPPPSTPTPTPTLTLTAHPSLMPTPTPVIDTIKGSFLNQISALEENMPRSKSEGYVIPTVKEQADFAELVAMLGADDLARAAGLADQNYYTLTYYIDRGEDQALNYLVREKRPIQKGWGLYAFRVDSTSNIIIEAPHPLYDKRTPSVALDIYRALDARALLIAGAHRNANDDGSADAAHTTDSIFQSIHLALSDEIQAASGSVIILQIHGFHTSKHAENHPQAVFGFGEKMQAHEITLAHELEEALSEQGISVGLCTGDVWQDLCGTTNAQVLSTSNGGTFIHIELDEKVRKDDNALIRALIQVFAE